MEAVLFFLLLLQIPMALRVRRVASRFALNEACDSFVGRYSGWRVTHYTGVVTFSASSTTSRSYVDVDSYTGQTIAGSHHTITDRHDRFRLRMPGGGIQDVQLLNFYAMVVEGDVVTVAKCSKGSKSRWFVVLNHTSNTSAFNDVDLHEITSPRHIMLVFNMIFTAMTLLGLITDGLYALLENRQRKNFKWGGMDPLRRKVAPAAAALGAA